MHFQLILAKKFAANFSVLQVIQLSRNQVSKIFGTKIILRKLLKQVGFVEPS